MYLVNALNIHPCEMMVIEFYTFMKKITIYVLGPELDELPRTRRKLTEPVPEEDVPAEFPPLPPKNKKKDNHGCDGKIKKL
jgi:hypothetical protein